MHFLKQGLAVFTVAIALFMTACTPEDSDCTAPAVEQNIVGTWTIVGGVASIEFQSNGTLVDPSDDLVGGFVGSDSFNVKTYTITNDTLYTSAASATTSNVLRGQYSIENNECDKISVSTAAGISFAFTRE